LVPAGHGPIRRRHGSENQPGCPFSGRFGRQFETDAVDLYVFRLKATNAVGAICIRTLRLTSVPANVAVLASPQRLPDGSFQLTMIGRTKQSYTLQVSTNLTMWTDWTNVTSARFSTSLTDPAATHDPQRFYRALTR